MTSAFETILYRKEGNIAEIALNRPRRLNAYNMQMRDDMHQALEAVRDDSDVRCLVLRGEARGRSAPAPTLRSSAPLPPGSSPPGAMGAGRLGTFPVSGQANRCGQCTVL